MQDLWGKLKTVFWTLILVLLTSIFLQNTEPTSLRVLFWSFAEMPKLVLILASFLLGSIVTLLAVWQMSRRRTHTLDIGE